MLRIDYKKKKKESILKNNDFQCRPLLKWVSHTMAHLAAALVIALAWDSNAWALVIPVLQS